MQSLSVPGKPLAGLSQNCGRGITRRSGAGFVRFGISKFLPGFPQKGSCVVEGRRQEKIRDRCAAALHFRFGSSESNPGSGKIFVDSICAEAVKPRLDRLDVCLELLPLGGLFSRFLDRGDARGVEFSSKSSARVMQTLARLGEACTTARPDAQMNRRADR